MTLHSPWHCVACGSEAVWLSASLDPTWPLGRCLGIHRKGDPVPVSRDLDAVAAIMATDKTHRARRLHARHIQTKRWSVYCGYCNAEQDRLHGRPSYATP